MLVKNNRGVAQQLWFYTENIPGWTCYAATSKDQRSLLWAFWTNMNGAIFDSESILEVEETHDTKD